MQPETALKLCAAVEILIVAVSVLLAVWKRNNLKSVIRTLGVGVFLSLVVMVLPYYIGGRSPYAFWLSVFNAMCAMLMNADPVEILESIGTVQVSFVSVYRAVLLFLFILAPLFTVGITLSFFSERFTRLLYRLRSVFRDSYLFSAVNERTVCLAENIAEKERKPLILFAISGSTEDESAELLSRIKKLGGYVLTGDISSVRHNIRRKRHYYLLDFDGSINLENGLRLFEKYNDAASDTLYMWLYTKDETASVIFDYLYEKFHVQLINEEQLIARQLVRDFPLYKAVTGNRLSILLVGAGNIGLEILRTVTWCGQLGDGIRTEIYVIDRDGDRAKALLAKSSPQLAERFGIRFYTADTETDSFPKVLSDISPDYIIVSLGEEKRNIRTGLYLRRFYGLNGDKPFIHILMDKTATEELLLPYLCLSDWKISADRQRYTEQKLCSFALLPFGSYEKTYGHILTAGSFDYWLAVAVNAVRIGITEINETHTPALLKGLYNQVEYYKNYAGAYAVSLPYKLYLMGLELVDDGGGDLSVMEETLPAFEDLLLRQEALRFEAFMRASGWTDLPLDCVHDGIYQDKLKKCHARLSAESTKKLSDITGRNFDAEDRQNLYRIPQILRLAGELSGKKLSVRKAMETETKDM